MKPEDKELLLEIYRNAPWWLKKKIRRALKKKAKGK